MSDQVTLTIDGRTVTVPKGTLLVEAAKLAGIEIPVFCYHPKLKPVGACRMCLVEIEKMPKLQTACTTPVSDGMVVHTQGEKTVDAQKAVLELLLANHPLDCPVCDKGGECPLQDNTFKFGPGASRFIDIRRHLPKAVPLSDRIVLDKERCIMCLRCVRFQREVPGDEAISIINRGNRSEIGVLPGESFDSPFSGNTIELCPVGALTSRQYRFRARPWDLKRTNSVCSGCSVGCNVQLHARNEQIVRLVSRENPEVDGSWLCDYGRFDTLAPVFAAAEQPAPAGPGTEYFAPMRGADPREALKQPVEDPARLRRPLVRVNGELQPATWTEALGRAAEVLRNGRRGLAASASLTNEAVWAIAEGLAPALGGSAPAAFIPAVPTQWPVRGDIANLETCRSLVVVGLDVWHDLPVLALWLRKAVQRGGRLVVINQENGLFRDTAQWIKAAPGDQLAVVEALTRALEGQTDQPDEIRAAAAACAGEPAALIVAPELVQSAEAVALFERLAARLGADPAKGGFVGAPGLSANARGVAELARAIAAGGSDPFAAAQSGALDSLVLIGDEPWPATGAARLVVLASRSQAPTKRGARAIRPAEASILDRETVEVVLPLAHLYEQSGSLTNLAGRVQRIEPGAMAPRQSKPDWAAVAQLASALGRHLPDELPLLRAELAAGHPAYGAALSGGLPPRGRSIQTKEAAGV